jgi:hypothetical protein
MPAGRGLVMIKEEKRRDAEIMAEAVVKVLKREGLVRAITEAQKG